MGLPGPSGAGEVGPIVSALLFSLGPHHVHSSPQPTLSPMIHPRSWVLLDSTGVRGTDGLESGVPHNKQRSLRGLEMAVYLRLALPLSSHVTLNR